MKSAIVEFQSRLATYNTIRMRDDGMEPIEPLSNNPAGPFPHGHASAQHCTGCPCAKREPPVIVGVLCRNEKAFVTHMPVCLPVVCGSVRARAYIAPKKTNSVLAQNLRGGYTENDKYLFSRTDP